MTDVAGLIHRNDGPPGVRGCHGRNSYFVVGQGKEVPMTAGSAGYFTPLATATYIRLITFRRDGRAVATPVHVVVTADGARAYFRTWDVTGKAKRIRHNAAVEVAPATFRGRPLGPDLKATARLLDGAESAQAAAMLAARHPVLHGRLIPWYHRRRGWTTQQYLLSPPG
jgi:uncharacterized protein